MTGSGYPYAFFAVNISYIMRYFKRFFKSFINWYFAISCSNFPSARGVGNQLRPLSPIIHMAETGIPKVVSPKVDGDGRSRIPHKPRKQIRLLSRAIWPLSPASQHHNQSHNPWKIIVSPASHTLPIHSPQTSRRERTDDQKKQSRW